jgi:hypothetical protein
MNRLLLLVASLSVLVTAQAAEVFKTKDAQGNIIYTDRPESLPAQKVNVATRSTDKAEVQREYEAQMQQNTAADKARADAAQQKVEVGEAKDLTAADRAKRCLDARNRYEQVMAAHRLYEPGEQEGERRYLDSKEIDNARASAKKTMDEFCSGQ